MTERPILFSTPMVRAILQGRKTQTRRAVKLQPPEKWGGTSERYALANFHCPYGKPGDRLWVRESLVRPDGDPWLYASDRLPVMVDKQNETEMLVWAHHKEQDHCPSIHMPRWASRIMLEITGVRVDRLQDISEEDAKEEGISFEDAVSYGGDDNAGKPDYVLAYRALWESINGKKHPWNSNPWVWVVEFRRVEL